MGSRETGTGLARLVGAVRQDSLLELLAALNEGLLVLDPQLRIAAMNPAAEALFGRSAADLAGVPVCRLFGEPACPRDVLEETLLSGAPIVDYQTTIDLGGGRRGHVVLRSASLRGDDGRGLGVALLLGDVTEVTDLRKLVTGRDRFGRLVGRDPRMRELYALITDVAGSGATVLIRGESGTGKELVARALHDNSGRAAGPFVAVNCSALTEQLLESELFGHVRGAFTGAVGDRRGRFAEASGGTIFLDEIGDVSPVVQVKLLRVLQERVVERVGDNRPLPVDVRVVSATHRDLEALVATGRVREDFYYRIKVVTLRVPPLRERREDIPLLAAHALERFAVRDGLPAAPALTEPALALLMAHTWPGNVRELENALDHALVLARGGPVTAAHLPPELREPARGGMAAPRPPAHTTQERELLERALAATGWNRTRAARRLGMDRSTLWRKIREYGLQPTE
ncbi:MAG: sigma 54-interacting transcriptional regulator [bacterium]|nr:sigma 54-interacting transcriptional regulator [bacterium]